jgi:hypothetical protein
MHSRRSFLLAALLLASHASLAQTAAAPCKVGVYQGPSGDFVTIVERANTSETGEWRYSFRDGRFGSTKGEVVSCVNGAVIVSREGSARSKWPEVALATTPTRFRSSDVMLAGLLVEPPGAKRNKPPLVVAVHGSENTASIRRNSYPYILAAQGISSFVFDKRGTGASEGTYHQNFHKLASDVVAASAEAKRLAAGRHGRFGLFGGSQGGWVAPRAANDAGADFVAVGFGLLLNPLEEDSEQVFTELRAEGYGEGTLAKARDAVAATGAVIASHFEAGYEQLAAVKSRFGAEPWFGKIKGEFTGDILAFDEKTLRQEGRAKYDNLDIDWHYDAIGELRKVKASQLWIVAGEDREAPPGVTIQRLTALRQEGKGIAIVRFPNTDHGMYEFTQAADGERTVTRVTDGYFRLLADWIKKDMHPPYGAAEWVSGK